MRGSKDDSEPEDFLTHYLKYIGPTECPPLYHRWCAIAALGTFLGRQFSFRFGHSHLHTNLYVMLIGVPAARKSTAIKIAKKIIIGAGYDHISADKTSKEKFLLDLAGEDTVDNQEEDILSQNLWGKDNTYDDHEMWIVCDEFNDFLGTGNIDFISMLGNLWDFDGKYVNRIKSGKSVNINNPTINILAGNTPVNFAKAFPADILGQGFFSRLLLVQADPTDVRITFPASPDPEDTAELHRHLIKIREYCKGEAEVSPDAASMLDKIYKTYRGIEDNRFEHYTGRRFSHLIKLCLIITASRCSRVITQRDVVVANTILSHTESLMPKALGEFGKSKNSEINHKIISILSNTDKPIGIRELWKSLSTDMDKIGDLSILLMSLSAADKIINVGGEFLAKKIALVEEDSDMVDYSILTQEEREATK